MDLQPGLHATVELAVTAADTAIALGSGDVAVLATPRVLALAEQAAVAAVADVLPQDRTTVGSWAEISHLAPTAVGASVTARAELSEVDGKRLTFSIVVTEEGQDVARVSHTRAIVSRSRFPAA